MNVQLLDKALLNTVVPGIQRIVDLHKKKAFKKRLCILITDDIR